MKRTAIKVLGILFLLAGMGIILYPSLQRMMAEKENLAVIEEIKKIREDENQPLLNAEDPLYQDMVSYNESLYQNAQQELTDAWSVEQPIFTLKDYGVVESAVGYLTIDAMNLQIPVYLGATKENLSNGAAVLGQTSMPIGGENTNCVIAAHRGNGRGVPMFLEIENLQVGDQVVLDNFWETLYYEVTETRIIHPTDIEAVKIQDGKDRITLITCHPYGDNYQRYVVYCQRVMETNEEKDSEVPETKERMKSSSEKAIERDYLLDKIGILLVALIGVLFLIYILRHRHSGKE